jgi:conjugal transfer/type IV secretion protein DotA/TraY
MSINVKTVAREVGKAAFPEFQGNGHAAVKTLAALSGVGPVAHLIGETGRGLARAGATIGGLWRAAAAADPGLDIPAEIDDSAARFAWFAQRAETGPVALEKAWRRFAAWFFASALLGLAGVWAFGEIRADQGVFWAALIAVSPLMVALPRLLNAALWHYQLRHRRLCGVGEFLRRPGEWIPPSDMDKPSNRGGRSLAALAVLGGLAFVATMFADGGVAHAAAALGDIDPTPRTDYPGQVITAIIAKGGSPLTHAVAMWTARIAAIAGAMLGYHTLHSVLAAARNGQVVGDRWNGVWGPLKVIIGMGMLAPVIGGGLNGAQGLIAEVGAISSNMASDIWVSYVEEVQAGGATTSPIMPSLELPAGVGGNELAVAVLRAETCATAIADRVAVWNGGSSSTAVEEGATPGQPGVPPIPAVSGQATGGFQVWSYGECGQVAVAIKPETDQAPQGTNNKPKAVDATAFYQARVKAVGDMINGVRNSGLASQISKARLSDAPAGSTWPQGRIIDALAPTVSAYDSAMKVAAAALINQADSTTQQAIVADAKAFGWFVAGGQDRVLAANNSEIVAIAAHAPSVIAPFASQKEKLTGGPSEQDARAIDADLNKQLSHEAQVPAPNGKAWAAPARSTDDSRIAREINDWLVDHIGGIAAGLETDKTDPMRSLVNRGNGLLATSEALLGFGLGVSILAPTSAVVWLTPFVSPVISGLLISGVSLAYILPMASYMAVLWAAVAWMTSIAECMIAAPLIMLTWVRLEGEELVGGAQRPGLLAVVNLAIRAPATILALIASTYLMPLALGLVNKTFAPAFGAALDGHVNPTGLLVALVFLGYLQVQVATRIAALVVTIPDKLIRFVGGHGDGHGEERAHEGAMSGAMAGAASGAAAGAGMAASAVQQQAASKRQRDEEARRQKEGAGAVTSA